MNNQFISLPVEKHTEFINVSYIVKVVKHPIGSKVFLDSRVPMETPYVVTKVSYDEVCRMLSDLCQQPSGK